MKDFEIIMIVLYVAELILSLIFFYINRISRAPNTNNGHG